jgi:hypothetical protein
MKIKVYVVDLEIPPPMKRRLIVTSVSLAVFGLGAIAFAAAVPNVFQDQDLLSASAMNANFAAVTQAQANGRVYSVGPTLYCGATVPTQGDLRDLSTPAQSYPKTKGACEGACNSPSAHMCTFDEVERSVALGVDVARGWFVQGLGGQGRSSAGASSDCFGFTTAFPNVSGASWAVDENNVVWGPGGTTCDQSLPLLCCD